MATALPALSPLWRNSLRTWLAATLTIGIMLWSGRTSVMLLGLLVAVLFINDNELTPLRFVSQMVGGALIGSLVQRLNATVNVNVSYARLLRELLPMPRDPDQRIQPQLQLPLPTTSR